MLERHLTSLGFLKPKVYFLAVLVICFQMFAMNTKLSRTEMLV